MTRTGTLADACDRLRGLLEEEQALRAATRRVFSAGQASGHERTAHEELMKEIVQACATLITRAMP